MPIRSQGVHIAIVAHGGQLFDNRVFAGASLFGYDTGHSNDEHVVLLPIVALGGSRESKKRPKSLRNAFGLRVSTFRSVTDLS